MTTRKASSNMKMMNDVIVHSSEVSDEIVEYFPLEKIPPYFLTAVAGVSAEAGTSTSNTNTLMMEESVTPQQQQRRGSDDTSGKINTMSVSGMMSVHEMDMVMGMASSGGTASNNTITMSTEGKRISPTKKQQNPPPTSFAHPSFSSVSSYIQATCGIIHNNNNVSNSLAMFASSSSTYPYHHTMNYQPTTTLGSSYSHFVSPSSVPSLQSPTVDESSTAAAAATTTVLPTWRLKERMKTVGVGLILALNIGTDPPDVQKPNPCAKLHCWIDPMSMSRAKARERIGERLEGQYARWQQRAKLKYKRALDPTIEDCRSTCVQLRKFAKQERVLLHYNGSGVPKPTTQGEIWIFDKHHTQYIPLSILDLIRWLGKPSILIFDCSGAGVLVPFLTDTTATTTTPTNNITTTTTATNGMTMDSSQYSLNPMYDEEERLINTTLGVKNNNNNFSSTTASTMYGNTLTSPLNDKKTLVSSSSIPIHSDISNTAKDPFTTTITADNSRDTIRDIIVLCPTAAHETLPFNPELPADLFTSCLTTPIAIALRWHILQNPLSCGNLDPDCVDSIPGSLNDRKTPLGELHWIFTAVTDTIAWNVLPSHMFQRLFRQDLLVASMFRNFLLADRIFRVLNCTPISYPALPSTCDHSLWQSWDMAVETSLARLVRDGVIGTRDRTSSSTQYHSSTKLSVDDGEHDRHQDGDDDDDDYDDGDDDDNDDGGVGGGGRDESHMGGHNPSQLLTSNTMLLATAGARLNVLPTVKTTGLSYGHDFSIMNSSFHSLHVMSPFFADQLTAFEIWLSFASTRLRAGGTILSPPLKLCDRAMGTRSNLLSLMYPGVSIDVESPEQLPIVLQVLLSQAHRVRALILLQKFLELGPSAVNLALCVGIFPYVLKLLQSPVDEYRHVLVSIWSSIIDFDPTCRVDLVKDGAVAQFIEHLRWGLQANRVIHESSHDYESKFVESHQDAACQRMMAAKILSVICKGYPLGQIECLRKNLHGVCSMLLMDSEFLEDKSSGNADEATINNCFPSQFRLWLCLAVGSLVHENASARCEATKINLHKQLLLKLNDDCVDVRASALNALGSMIGAGDISKTHSVSTSMDNIGKISSTKPAFIVNPQMIGSSGPTRSSLYGIGFSTTSIHQAQSMFTLNPFQQHKDDRLVDSERIVQQREIDCEILKKVIMVSSDASAIVRFEAIIVLAVAVEKYIEIFEAIADNMPGKGHESEIELTKGLQSTLNLSTHSIAMNASDQNCGSMDDQSFQIFLTKVWKRLRLLQHSDPYPAVSSAATSIISLVYDHVLKRRVQGLSNEDRCHLRSTSTLFPDTDKIISPHPMHQISRVSSALTIHPSTSLRLLPNENTSPPRVFFRRNQSDLPLVHSNAETITSTSPSLNPIQRASEDSYKITPPSSQFYDWKKTEFHHLEQSHPSFDLLSKEGALKIHRDERNLRTWAQRSFLIDHFSVLNPKEMKPEASSDGIAAPIDLLSLNDDDKENEAVLISEAASRKKELYFHQSGLLSSPGESKRTTALRFHLCEPILASCDDRNIVTVWDVTSGGRAIMNFKNFNPSSSRITSLAWMNELSKSLLMIGSDDGSIKIWGGILDNFEEITYSKPILYTGFSAIPELNPGKRGSGLVSEWQQSHGRLIVGGNCPRIRCWDLEAEKCRNIIDNDMSVCLTSITTTWDSFLLSTQTRVDGSSGLGPDIIIAGYGDGTICAYDLRISNVGAVSDNKSDPRSRLRERWIKQARFTEHSNWVVNSSFRQVGSRYEVSGYKIPTIL